MALLRALLELWPSADAGGLVLAHLNHQLRGAESDADEGLLREQFRTWQRPGLALCCARRDVAGLAREARGNLEDVARQVRYRWLTDIAQQHKAAWVATGHTADDQAETVLHRLLRGTGLKGLRGIAAQRPLTAGIRLLRPLLAVSRAEVLAYLEEQGQPYRHDRSNDDPGFTRNRIRNELLPYLAEHYNPTIAGVLGRLAEQADEAYRETEESARRLLEECEHPRAHALLYLDRRKLTAAPRSLVREVFRLVWAREGWPMGGMSFNHWDRLAALVQGDIPAADFPGGISAVADGRVLRLTAPIP